MSEVARSSGNSSEAERGEMPELAALGTMLRSLFNTLDISQRQYACRVHLDASVVSRYLSGRRISPRHFVDRLISEVEAERGSSVTPEVREKIETTWLTALKACDPDAFRLENLRTDLTRSRRDAERAHRTVEALQLLLEQKESQVHEVGRELVRLQADWAADRANAARTEIESQRERESVTASRDALLREIENLKNDLREAERLRSEAEEHSRELREQVLRLEADLAERGPAGEAPVDVLKAQLERMWGEENFPEATRELTEAAWSRPVDELVELSLWLMETYGSWRLAPFMADIGRLRPVDDVLNVVRRMSDYDRLLLGDHALANAIASRITLRNVAAFCRGLAELGPAGMDLWDNALTEVVVGADTASYAVDLILQVLTVQESTGLFRAAVREAVGLYLQDSFPYLVAVGLFEAGRPDAAEVVLDVVVSFARIARDSAEEAGRLYRGLQELDERSLRTLFVFIAAQSSPETAARFAQAVYREAARSSAPGPLDQLAVLGPKVLQWAHDHSGSLSTEVIDYLEHLKT
ncbi:hypothetical protein ACWEKM_19035 [Streptomyces sp. NPDC004752]